MSDQPAPLPLNDGHDTPARSAEEAAQRLAALGRHVHYTSNAETRCVTGHCKEA